MVLPGGTRIVRLMSVLLRPDQLVTIDEQHGQIPAVLGLEFRHAGSAREFSNEEQLAGDGFVERQVRRRLILAADPRAADERDDGEVTEGLGSSEIEFFECVRDVHSYSSVIGSHDDVCLRRTRVRMRILLAQQHIDRATAAIFSRSVCIREHSLMTPQILSHAGLQHGHIPFRM